MNTDGKGSSKGNFLYMLCLFERCVFQHLDNFQPLNCWSLYLPHKDLPKLLFIFCAVILKHHLILKYSNFDLYLDATVITQTVFFLFTLGQLRFKLSALFINDID